MDSEVEEGLDASPDLAGDREHPFAQSNVVTVYQFTDLLGKQQFTLPLALIPCFIVTLPVFRSAQVENGVLRHCSDSDTSDYTKDS